MWLLLMPNSCNFGPWASITPRLKGALYLSSGMPFTVLFHFLASSNEVTPTCNLRDLPGPFSCCCYCHSFPAPGAAMTRCNCRTCRSRSCCFWTFLRCLMRELRSPSLNLASAEASGSRMLEWSRGPGMVGGGGSSSTSSCWLLSLAEKPPNVPPGCLIVNLKAGGWEERNQLVHGTTVNNEQGPPR